MAARIILKRNEERRIKSGHLWVFSNEIEKVDGSADNGDLVEVFDSKQNFLGVGFYNKNSLISVRMLSSSRIDDLYSVLEKKLMNAWELRKNFYPNLDSFRLVFSESDFLPGLIIDKYNNTFVLQIYSYGMQKNINLIVEILKGNFGAENIFSKNESYFRKLEGLPETDEIYLGEKKSELINDGLIDFKINFEKGHKTGFYFDQRDNRFFIEKIVNGKTVIDAFCNSGGFGLHAAKAGAASINFVDSSSTEIENAKHNYEINNLNSNAEFIVSDVFDYFEKLVSEKNKFDVVMIDPPAFAKSKKQLPVAKKGYERLNKLALQLLNENGYLVTSSCSHHVTKEDFIQIVTESARKADKKIQLIHFNGASLDHPELPSMIETSYLKFGVFKVE
ncbi:MAG: class I SAM-dependent rRNA methyltransferase [Bacteroidetes bacterium]|nr:class I SAM-dependent rRNA methyltransferase [Bacteroidota bacterium]